MSRIPETKNQLRLKEPEIMFLSFFGVGFIPKAPGTWGTLCALPFLYLLGLFQAPFFLFIPFLLITTIASCYVAQVIQQKYQLHDPQWIVIDEVLGMSVAWLFIQNHTILDLLVLFIIFRFFDIIKFFPASYFDKKVHHGMGTILDDIISGLYAGVTYLLIHRIIISS